MKMMFAKLLVLSVLCADASAMGIREWLGRQTNAAPPVVVTNAIPENPPTQPLSYEWDASRLVLAGVDRDWYDLNPSEVCALARSTGANGISIEMVGNDTPRTQAQLQAKYNAYLSEARKLKLVVFVCVVNDWVKSSFYSSGDANKMLSVVLNGGSDGVIAQPVGETRTSQGLAFEKSATAKLKAAGFKTCYNGNGGRPSGKNGMDYHAWHSSGTPSTAPRGSIEITDHGTSIRDIGYFDVAKVEKYARSAKSRGAGFGLYRYVGMGNNGSPRSLPVSASAESWRAMARVYAEGGSKPPPPQANTGDELDISSFVGLGPHKGVKPQNIAVTRAIKSAKLSATAISFSHDNLNWPGNSPIGSNIDGRVFVFWIEGGRVTGGHFEWRRPDTRSKDVNNIRNGYLDGKKPPTGATIWLCFVNDWIGGGRAERTQVIKCDGVWK